MSRTPALFSLGLPLRAAAVIVIGVIVFVSQQTLRYPSMGHHAAPPTLAAPTAWPGSFDEHVEALTQAIEHLSLPFRLPAAAKEPQGGGAMQWTHHRYDVPMPKPIDLDSFDRLFDGLRQAFPQATVQSKDTADGPEMSIGIDGLRTHTIGLHSLKRKPRVAIVIDGVGNDLLVVRDLVELNVPLTYTVMPFGVFSKTVAQRLALSNSELVVRLPVESKAAPTAQPKAAGAAEATRTLAATASAEEVEAYLDDAFADVPRARGLSTSGPSDPTRLRWILERAKRNRMFFLDVGTTKPAPCESAEKIAVACLRRSIALDDTDSEEAVHEQLTRLLSTAQSEGDGVAVARPRPATIAALKADLPRFAEAGVEIVPVSQLVGAKSLSRP